MKAEAALLWAERMSRRKIQGRGADQAQEDRDPGLGHQCLDAKIKHQNDDDPDHLREVTRGAVRVLVEETRIAGVVLERKINGKMMKSATNDQILEMIHAVPTMECPESSGFKRLLSRAE